MYVRDSSETKLNISYNNSITYINIETRPVLVVTNIRNRLVFDMTKMKKARVSAVQVSTIGDMRGRREAKEMKKNQHTKEADMCMINEVKNKT